MFSAGRIDSLDSHNTRSIGHARDSKRFLRSVHKHPSTETLTHLLQVSHYGTAWQNHDSKQYEHFRMAVQNWHKDKALAFIDCSKKRTR